MSTVDWAMLPRHPLATFGSAGRGARAFLMAFGLLPLSGCHVVLFGGPPPWGATQHPVGHLLVFVLASVVVILLLAVIDGLILWAARRRGTALIASGDGHSTGFLKEPHAWDEIGADFEENPRGLL